MEKFESHSAKETEQFAADLAAKADDGIAKLHRYAADPFVPELAKDTTLHLILFQFKGTELVRLEEIAKT